jgi:uncharacterized membrane protein YebE (DUF533 family)
MPDDAEREYRAFLRLLFRLAASSSLSQAEAERALRREAILRAMVGAARADQLVDDEAAEYRRTTGKSPYSGEPLVEEIHL